MVRSVQFEAAIEKFADQQVLERKPAEVGVVIGRTPTAGKDYVLQLVQCPDQGDAPPITASASNTSKPSAKSTKPAAGSLSLDQEWIVEHAAQVARLLPGGLDVLGLYMFCPEASMTASTSKLSALLKEAKKELGLSTDPMLVGIDSVTGKISVKELSGTSIRPCEAKPSSVIANMMEISCSYPVNIQVQVAPGKKNLSEAVYTAIARERDQVLKQSIPLIDGSQPPSDKQIGEVVVNSTSRIEFCRPLPSSMLSGLGQQVDTVFQRDAGQYSSAGTLNITGNLDCRAFVHKREAANTAVLALETDISRSLAARLDVLVEAIELSEAEVTGDQQSKHPLLSQIGADSIASSTATITLPQRALVKWTQGGGCFCDYFMANEAADGAIARLQELVGTTLIQGSAIEYREAPSSSNTKVKMGASGLSARGGGAVQVPSCSPLALGASCIAALAALIGYMVLES